MKYKYMLLKPPDYELILQDSLTDANEKIYICSGLMAPILRSEISAVQ